MESDKEGTVRDDTDTETEVGLMEGDVSICKLCDSPETCLSPGVWCLCVLTCTHVITYFSFVLQGKLGTKLPTNYTVKFLAFGEITLVSTSGVQWISLILDLPAW